MTELAVIGGSGLTALAGLSVDRRRMQQTPYGDPSGPLNFGTYAGAHVIFLARHGQPHAIPPHRVNYRANLWALKENGVNRIISVNAVGGISAAMQPRRLVIPDQIIDYTWSRAHTYFEENLERVKHVDFTRPYDEPLRQTLLRCAAELGIDALAGGTYGATQGPRLESAAEIRRMERDGCDIVGMTGMPETALARELGLRYASISVVANYAAGKADGQITMDMIERNLSAGIKTVKRLLQAAIPVL